MESSGKATLRRWHLNKDVKTRRNLLHAVQRSVAGWGSTSEEQQGERCGGGARSSQAFARHWTTEQWMNVLSESMWKLNPPYGVTWVEDLWESVEAMGCALGNGSMPFHHGKTLQKSPRQTLSLPDVMVLEFLASTRSFYSKLLCSMCFLTASTGKGRSLWRGQVRETKLRSSFICMGWLVTWE